MDWLPAGTAVACLGCGRRAGFDEPRCSTCGGLLEVRLDPAAAPIGDSPRPFGDRAVGETPLCASTWLPDELAGATVYVKDEGRNPTGHISDRDMTLVAAEHGGGGKALAVASPGRSGIAAAAAAAANDLDSRVVVPSRAPFATKALINVHGGDMRVVQGRYSDAESAFVDEADATDWVDARPIEHPLARAGRASAFYELFTDRDWTAPTIVVVPVGSGATLLASVSAVDRAIDAEAIDRRPRIVIAQPAGCAPLVEAIHGGAPPEPWSEPDTICGELEVPAPTHGGLIGEIAARHEIEGIAVPDPAALEAAVRTSQADGLQLSVAGGVAAAAATDLAGVDETDTVVILNPGTATIDADVLRSHLMGQGI